MNSKINFNLKDNGKWHSILSKLNLFLFYVTVISLLVSFYRLFILRWNNIFLLPKPEKDEVGYLNTFLEFKQFGWYHSVAKGCSPLFNLFSWIINLFIDNPLFSMKTVSLLSMGIIFVIWFYFINKYTNIKKPLKIVLILFILNLLASRHSFFTAYDDPLFFVFITGSFLCIYNAFKSYKKEYLLYGMAGILFACAASTRPLFVFYILGFAFIFCIVIFNSRKNIKELILFSISFILMISIIHFPSLKENHKLSFHNKDFQSKNVTWVEINYLFLLKNKENLLHGRNNKLKPTPEEIIEYRDKFGETSLPKTYFETYKSLPLDLLIKNFIGLLYLQATPFLRQIGLFFPFFMLFSFFIFFKNKFKINHHLLPVIFYISFAFSLCIMPIVHLEFRWFNFFTILITVFSFDYLGQSFNGYNYIKLILIYINIFIISMLNIFYVGVW